MTTGTAGRGWNMYIPVVKIGETMEFVPVVVVTLLVYTAFVVFCIRLVGMIRRKDQAATEK
jgi:hypothetical protein